MTRQTARGLLPEVLKPFDRFSIADRRLDGIARTRAGLVAPGRLHQPRSAYRKGRAA